MTDFFSRLGEQVAGTAEVIQPLHAPFFAPLGDVNLPAPDASHAGQVAEPGAPDGVVSSTSAFWPDNGSALLVPQGEPWVDRPVPTLRWLSAILLFGAGESPGLLAAEAHEAVSSVEGWDGHWADVDETADVANVPPPATLGSTRFDADIAGPFAPGAISVASHQVSRGQHATSTEAAPAPTPSSPARSDPGSRLAPVEPAPGAAAAASAPLRVADTAGAVDARIGQRDSRQPPILAPKETVAPAQLRRETTPTAATERSDEGDWPVMEAALPASLRAEQSSGPLPAQTGTAIPLLAQAPAAAPLASSPTVVPGQREVAPPAVHAPEQNLTPLVSRPTLGNLSELAQIHAAPVVPALPSPDRPPLQPKVHRYPPAEPAGPGAVVPESQTNRSLAAAPDFAGQTAIRPMSGEPHVALVAARQVSAGMLHAADDLLSRDVGRPQPLATPDSAPSSQSPESSAPAPATAPTTHAAQAIHGRGVTDAPAQVGAPAQPLLPQPSPSIPPARPAGSPGIPVLHLPAPAASAPPGMPHVVPAARVRSEPGVAARPNQVWPASAAEGGESGQGFWEANSPQGGDAVSALPFQAISHTPDGGPAPARVLPQQRQDVTVGNAVGRISSGADSTAALWAKADPAPARVSANAPMSRDATGWDGDGGYAVARPLLVPLPVQPAAVDNRAGRSTPPDPLPTVHVTIGRVEVRYAPSAPKPAPAPRRPEQRSHALDEMLKRDVWGST